MTPARTITDALACGEDSAWVLSEDGPDPLRDSSRESRFAISNGFMGVRGAQAVNRRAYPAVLPHTYVAGVFDVPDTEPSTPGLVPAADWLQVRIFLDGRPLAPTLDGQSSRRVTLEMQRGLVLTDWRRWGGTATGARVRTLRLVSLSERAMGMQQIQVDIEDEAVEVTVEMMVEGAHLGLVAERHEQDMGVWRTERSGQAVGMAVSASLRLDDQGVPPTRLGPLKWTWSWTSRAGQVACFSRLVAVTRSDIQGDDAGLRARAELDTARSLGWSGVLDAHEGAWEHRWELGDVEVEGDAAAQKALRFALYHLVGAANPTDASVSIGARALTGDDYRGHVFWDTEIFLLPFYTFTWPAAARALLMYRFRTLPEARAKATRMGWRGALYAWESADTGAEATPAEVVGPDRKVVEVLCGSQEQHISADIAYAVWQYWLATGDEAFLLSAGAEILLETGRFWASRGHLEADGRRHIRGVIGPDEYHETIDDNAYTNVMARWNIRRALDTAALLKQTWPGDWSRLAAALVLTDVELDAWRAAANSLADGFDPESGLFEQFEGYFGLEDIDLGAYAGRSVPMDVVLGRERTERSQVVKQADVVALLALLPEEFPPGAAEKNFRYYEQRCSHGSSLSRAMHGLVAARLGDRDMALRYFHENAAIDLADTHVAIEGGIHIASLGGVWTTAVFGFAGLSLRDDGVRLAPKLPTGWRRLSFPVQWRGRRLRISIDGDHLEATLQAGAPMMLTVFGTSRELNCGRTLRINVPGGES